MRFKITTTGYIVHRRTDARGSPDIFIILYVSILLRPNRSREHQSRYMMVEHILRICSHILILPLYVQFCVYFCICVRGLVARPSDCNVTARGIDDHHHRWLVEDSPPSALFVQTYDEDITYMHACTCIAHIFMYFVFCVRARGNFELMWSNVPTKKYMLQ